jgi:hypothetical protein
MILLFWLPVSRFSQALSPILAHSAASNLSRGYSYVRLQREVMVTGSHDLQTCDVPLFLRGLSLLFSLGRRKSFPHTNTINIHSRFKDTLLWYFKVSIFTQYNTLITRYNECVNVVVITRMVRRWLALVRVQCHVRVWICDFRWRSNTGPVFTCNSSVLSF